MSRATWLLLVSLLGLAVALFGLLGWRGRPSGEPPVRLFDDMSVQPRYGPQQESAWFADRRTQRLPPVGAVPWGRDARTADPAFAIAPDEEFGRTTLRGRLDRPLLQRGRRLYDVYCALCHGGAGLGDGVVTRYGLINPPSYHVERLVLADDGELFKVITLGKGQMAPYAERLDPAERWAVVAYLRALQRAFRATLDDVPDEVREELLR